MTSTTANYREAFRLHAQTVRRYELQQCSFDAVAKSAAALKYAKAAAQVAREEPR